MAEKELYCVRVEGRVWVMAENAYDAQIQARWCLADEAEHLVQEADLVKNEIQNNRVFAKYIDDDERESEPWNGYDRHDRTVGQLVEEILAGLAAKTEP